MTTRHLTRRDFLTALGVSLALPSLELFGGDAPGREPPKRVIFIYVPNGIYLNEWTPGEANQIPGAPQILAPLVPFRPDWVLLGGLTLDAARGKEDGPGDHARASATFLTGGRIRKTSGTGLRVARPSVDQLIAEQFKDETRFASLELGCENSRPSGRCDSDYSCAYVNNVTWRTPTSPMTKEINPHLVFNRLFGARAQNGLTPSQMSRRKSLLDFSRETAQRLKGRVGAGDGQKIDEYLTGLRTVERRMEHEAHLRSGEPLHYIGPEGVPTDFRTHAEIMCDLITLAFQNDSTRVVTLMLSFEGSNRPYPSIEVPEGHHDLSHHGNDPAKIKHLVKINELHVQQLAYLMGKLKSIREAGGTSLLDQTAIIYGSGISDGQNHTHEDLPLLLAGGLLKSPSGEGRLGFPVETPLCNLYVSLLEAMGSRHTQFGDSTGKLPLA